MFSARVVFPDPEPPAIPTKIGKSAKIDIVTQKKIKNSFTIDPSDFFKSRRLYSALSSKYFFKSFALRDNL